MIKRPQRDLNLGTPSHFSPISSLGFGEYDPNNFGQPLCASKWIIFAILCLFQLLLRKNAAEALKKEQEEKAKLRQEMIEQRCGKPKSREGLGENELRSLCNEYQEKICQIESDKYDLEKEVEFKDYQINELNIAVNDLRGKL